MKNKNLFIFGCFGIILLFCSGFTGLFGGLIGYYIVGNNNTFIRNSEKIQVVNEESAVIDVANKASASVVSIVITQNVPIYENYRINPFFNDWGDLNRKQIGTEEQEVGAGTGFIVSKDGLIVTNRHVVDQDNVSYTIFLSDGSKKEAKVLAKDTLLDIALLDIDGDNFTALSFGDSDSLKVGQNVIAIGNALGEFSNSVSTGIISGLSRKIVAGDQTGRFSERLNNVIQTDASINLGNSGGPLMDLTGNVIGVNVAIAGDAENIGFAIPSNLVKKLVDNFQKNGKIERPILGVRFINVNESVKKDNNLSVDYGALITSNRADQLAIIPGSPAEKAGLKINDIVLEVDSVRIDENLRLNEVIQSKEMGSSVSLKVLRDDREINITVLLDKSSLQ